MNMSPLMTIGTRWLLTLLCCIAVGFGLMVAISCIPEQPIRNHLQSTAIFKTTPDKSHIVSLFERAHYTESIMLQLACTADTNAPVNSALESKTYTLGKFMEDPIKDFNHLVISGTEQMKEDNYCRYWHGYLTTLRPMLYFFDVPTIRWYTLILFSVLATIYLTLIKRTAGWLVMGIFALGLLHAGVLKNLIFSLDQNKVFFIIFISCIILAKSQKLHLSARHLPLFFIVVGAVTSFVDFLTAPVLTLGIPLTIVFLKREEGAIKDQLSTIIICSIAWCFGYVGMWASKWGLCAMLTDSMNFYTCVFGSLYERSIGDFSFDFCRACQYLLYPIPDLGRSWWIAVTSTLGLGIASHLVFLIIRHRQQFLSNICYLIIALYPLIWIMGTRQHTIIHLVFTYRIMELFIIAYCIFAIKVHRQIKQGSNGKLNTVAATR